MLEFLVKVIEFIVVLSVLIVIHELGHFFAAVRSGVRVEIFSVGFGKKLLSRRYRDTEYALSAIPLGGYVKFSGDSLEDVQGKPYEYLSQPVSRRFAIISSGPLMNYLFGFLLFWLAFCIGFPMLGTKVKHVADGSGAYRAGIVSGDIIVAVENEPVVFWSDLVSRIQEHKQQPSVRVTAMRGSDRLDFDVPILDLNTQDFQERKVTIKGIGVGYDIDYKIMVRHGIVRACIAGFSKTVDLTVLTYRSLWNIVSGKIAVRKSVAGPVAMFDIFQKLRRINDIVVFMAIVSISLAIFNLLPFPALDGGHLLLLGVEKIRRRYLSKRAEDLFIRVGLTFLIGVAVLVFFNDLANRGLFARAADLWKKSTGASDVKNP